MQLEDRISRYLDKTPGAIQGSGGDDQTFAVACALVWGFALDTATALHWLGVYNKQCSPPWKERDLRHKVSQAEKAAHDKPSGYLLGAQQSTGEGQRVTASITVAKPVPVRLTPRKERFRTLRTTISNPYGHTREKELPHTHRSVGAFHPSEASEDADIGIPITGGTSAGIPVDPLDWTAINAAFPPDDEEKNWQAVIDAGFGDEPLISLAFATFGPGCKVLEESERLTP